MSCRCDRPLFADPFYTSATTHTLPLRITTTSRSVQRQVLSSRLDPPSLTHLPVRHPKSAPLMPPHSLAIDQATPDLISMTYRLRLGLPQSLIKEHQGDAPSQAVPAPPTALRRSTPVQPLSCLASTTYPPAPARARSMRLVLLRPS
jgi:hypothetical protein